MTAKENSEVTGVFSQLRKVQECSRFGIIELGQGFTGGKEDYITETREADHPELAEEDLLDPTLSSLDYPHWI